VVAAIAAYNFPLFTAVWKIIPALLTGNTVVLRPNPLTPLVTLSSVSRGAAVPPPLPMPSPAPASAGNPAAGGQSAETVPPTTQAVPPPAKGMVWVNLDSKIFHREGDPWYGRTKHGQYMSDADALKAGYREAKKGGRPKGAQP